MKDTQKSKVQAIINALAEYQTKIEDGEPVKNLASLLVFHANELDELVKELYADIQTDIVNNEGRYSEAGWTMRVEIDMLREISESFMLYFPGTEFNFAQTMDDLQEVMQDV